MTYRVMAQAIPDTVNPQWVGVVCFSDLTALSQLGQAGELREAG